MAYALLFANGSLADALSRQAALLRDEVDAAPEAHLLTADVEAWVSALVHRYRVESPQLHADQVSLSRPEEIKIDARRDVSRDVRDRSRPVLVDGYRVAIHVPFTGDETVFNLQPSSITGTVPEPSSRSAQIKRAYEVERPCAIRRVNEALHWS